MEDDVSKITADLSYGTWRFQRNWAPLHIVDAEGCYFTDAAGKRYLDFSSQLMCVNIGHKNPKVIEAICEQAKKLPYISPAFATDVRAELCKLLLEVLPAGLEKFFFCSSGTEANEAAIKIARMYTGKSKILARYRSYHGSTSGSLSLTGDPRRWSALPGARTAGAIFGPEVYCYRCPIKHSYPDCGVACVEYIDHMLEQEGDVAAVLVEPVAGTNGVLVPPKEYMPRLREICDRRGALLIADEVMSGWGRTGEWFAVNHWNVIPDILTTAKGITSGYIPLGLCATTRKISDHFQDHFFAHGHTYEAHPLTLATAIAAIKELQRADLIRRSAELGTYLGEKLCGLYRHPSVGEVRGMGLFWAVDLTTDRKTRKPFHALGEKLSGKPLIADRVAAEMMKNGVLIMPWINHFVIAPPLIITREQIDNGVDALDAALRIADELVQDGTST